MIYVTGEMKDFFEVISNVKEVKKKTRTTFYSPIVNFWQYFYLCLMLGLHLNDKSKREISIQPSTTKKSDIKEKDLKDYLKAHRLNLIWSVYIQNEIDNESIDTDKDRKEILNFISKKFPPSDNHAMSLETMNDLNAYALAGLDHLNQAFDNKPPQRIDEFFEKYAKLLG
jgi:hypothetical protein